MKRWTLWLAALAVVACGTLRAQGTVAAAPAQPAAFADRGGGPRREGRSGPVAHVDDLAGGEEVEALDDRAGAWIHHRHARHIAAR